MIRLLREMLDRLVQRFVAWSADLDRRGRAGLLGRWPWQPKPKTCYIALDACATEAGAEQIGKAALAEGGHEFVVVHYRDVEGSWRTAIVEAHS